MVRGRNKVYLSFDTEGRLLLIGLRDEEKPSFAKTLRERYEDRVELSDASGLYSVRMRGFSPDETSGAVSVVLRDLGYFPSVR